MSNKKLGYRIYLEFCFQIERNYRLISKTLKNDTVSLILVERNFLKFREKKLYDAFPAFGFFPRFANRGENMKNLTNLSIWKHMSIWTEWKQMSSDRRCGRLTEWLIPNEVCTCLFTQKCLIGGHRTLLQLDDLMMTKFKYMTANHQRPSSSNKIGITIFTYTSSCQFNSISAWWRKSDTNNLFIACIYHETDTIISC